MEIVKKCNEIFTSLDSKEFYTYLAITIGIIVALMSGLGWYYLRTAHSYMNQIQEINNLRTNDIKDLFTAHQRIIAEQKQVNTLLAQDPNFKIRDYFDKLLNMLGLTQKRVTESSSSVDREEYRETILNATFSDMNMQELCELLQALENAQRIFTKELDITRSKKPDKIDAMLVIATLQPKTSS